MARTQVVLNRQPETTPKSKVTLKPFSEALSTGSEMIDFVRGKQIDARDRRFMGCGVGSAVWGIIGVSSSDVIGAIPPLTLDFRAIAKKLWPTLFAHEIRRDEMPTDLAKFLDDEGYFTRTVCGKVVQGHDTLSFENCVYNLVDRVMYDRAKLRQWAATIELKRPEWQARHEIELDLLTTESEQVHPGIANAIVGV